MRLKIQDYELSTIKLFRDLGTDQVQLLASHLHRRSVGDRTTIITMGQTGCGVFFLLHGTVKICVGANLDTEERNTIVALCGPGEVLGEMDALDCNGHSSSVVTIEPCHFLWLSADDFRSCIRLAPGLSRNLNEVLTHRLRRLTAKDHARSALSLEGRVARQLLLFSHDYGTAHTDGTLLPLQFRQADLAALVGSVRPRVNRVLNGFKRMGYVSFDSSGRYVLRDCEALRHLCDIHTDALLLRK
jgi:CRP-like cAMP-binding protein